MVRPVSINHVGAVVPDIEAAIRWYTDVMGFGLIAGPFDLTRHVPNIEQIKDVLGGQLIHLRIAHMTTGNAVGFELFEPIDPPLEKRENMVEFWRAGYFHICVTDPDVEALVERIVETGGQKLSQIWPDRPPPKEEFRMCYCTDPFGNVIEVYSHSYDLMQGHPIEKS